MRVAFVTVCLSPHQLPLADAIVARVGADNFRYISNEDVGLDRGKLGWESEGRPWCRSRADTGSLAEIDEWCRNADVLFCYLREPDVFEDRVRRGLLTIYVSERWFKPIAIRGFELSGLLVPGWVRMLNPRYFRMALCFRRLLGDKTRFLYFPMGVHAARDMARLRSWGHPVFSPQVPCAAFRKMRLWGYFVTPSRHPLPSSMDRSAELSVLWVGRLLQLKRVDTIIQAVCSHAKRRLRNRLLPALTLDIYGIGPDERRLKEFASGCDMVHFHAPVPITDVRELMRNHDVYVFSSTGLDGWGAVVSEALEEGMHVLGTYEAGSSATMLTDHDLFHAGDWRRLQMLLERCLDEKRCGTLRGQGIGEWSAEKAADRLLALIIDEMRK